MRGCGRIAQLSADHAGDAEDGAVAGVWGVGLVVTQARGGGNEGRCVRERIDRPLRPGCRSTRHCAQENTPCILNSPQAF
jgi:hypothetical protein